VVLERGRLEGRPGEWVGAEDDRAVAAARVGARQFGTQDVAGRRVEPLEDGPVGRRDLDAVKLPRPNAGDGRIPVIAVPGEVLAEDGVGNFPVGPVLDQDRKST